MKVLVADDDAATCWLLESLLAKWGYQVVAVEDGLGAWQALQAEDAPRLALLDWMMPGMDGVEVCREARKRVAQPYIYILLLTAKDGQYDVIEGLESGADDYLTKPFNPQELQSRLRAGKRIVDLEDSLLSAREVLQFKATHDLLTGLWNRAAILDIFEREVPRAAREGGSLGVLLVDLDHFKLINDTLGHAVGDQVLQEVARRMLASVRVYDSIGRYGGEEFLILVPGCDTSSAREKGEQLRAAVAASPVDTPAGPIRVTLSAGVASTSGWLDADPDLLLRAADVALYRAKSTGRDRVEVAVAARETHVTKRPADDFATLAAAWRKDE